MVEFDRTASCTSLDNAILMFRDVTKALGVRDVVYGYMLESKSYVRQDACFSVTLSDELMALDENSGGLSTDPIASAIADAPSYYKVDIKDWLELDQGNERAQRPYIKGLLAAGYSSLYTFPFHDVELVGYGTMTLFQDESDKALRIDPTILDPLVKKFHLKLKRSGLLAKLFSLSAKEVDTLRLTAAGKIAEDIATTDCVTPRTVELRLAKAREKLHARNSTEAVFKAMAYGIIRDRS